MLRQSNHKDRELHKVKINSGLTAKKLKITLEDLNFFVVLPILLFASSQPRLWFCESSSHLQNLRRDQRSHTLGQQANHLCSCQHLWSTSDAFWWSALLLQPAREYQPDYNHSPQFVQPQIHLELLSVAFILNVRGFFIGLRTSFKLLPFLYHCEVR